jgi:hypothetical protein
VWRPIRAPGQDSPLALRDAQSFTDGNVIATHLVYPHPPGKTGSRDKHRASFETAASRLPQDEVFFLMPSPEYLILSRPRSGRVEGSQDVCAALLANTFTNS